MAKKAPHNISTTQQEQDIITSLEENIVTLSTELAQAQEKERRALADYQNLLRRTQEERVRFMKMANAEILESFLQPLEHLSLAAAQIQDPGLNMVVHQFTQILEGFGLKEIEVLGKEFDVETMEVVENAPGDSQRVTSVVKKGYSLNGQVIQHAKVILGNAK